ncbi:hypothetical protein CPB84DRAFT_1432172 [Gymnopilus junonius]|uniref:Uncharacterized protein n=1 Tax=Gymnopilus junonius TaxID=109634 RepID=A0A9P5TSJ9_GYMJU|nr:hypothetical protein CPB84DRAFT_1432172 [Gymnopilus junonius]
MNLEHGISTSAGWDCNIRIYITSPKWKGWIVMSNAVTVVFTLLSVGSNQATYGHVFSRSSGSFGTADGGTIWVLIMVPKYSICIWFFRKIISEVNSVATVPETDRRGQAIYVCTKVVRPPHRPSWKVHRPWGAWNVFTNLLRRISIYIVVYSISMKDNARQTEGDHITFLRLFLRRGYNEAAFNRTFL